MVHESTYALQAEGSENEDERNDFEAAISACGFGFFNICLLFASLPGLWATMFETTTMSYVLPAAECDLELSLIKKGALNAITFAGMVISALPWGFAADTFGRKKILVSALLMEGALTLLSVLSRTAEQLMAYKFFGGFISCGPLAIFVAYIAEFHGIKYRKYVVIAIGLINSVPLILLPVTATVMLPKREEYTIGPLKLNSWRIFIAITALPALLSGFLLIFFPESPKYLMSQGKNDKALQAFRRIYAVNKFKNKDTYPITTLLEEAPNTSKKRKHHQMWKHFFKKMAKGLKQIPLLCNKEHVGITLKVCCTYFFLILSVNAIRLWLPQYFSTAREMKQHGFNVISNCDILEYSLNKTHQVESKTDEQELKCEVIIEAASYVNNIIIAAALCVNYIVTTFLVFIIGNNILLRINMGVSIITLIAKYWSNTVLLSLILSALFTASGIVCITLLLNTTVNLYPTSMRTMAVIFLMSWGRIGGAIGNIILPSLMTLHCAAIPAFFGASILCSLIISFFLPNTTKEPLK